MSQHSHPLPEDSYNDLYSVLAETNDTERMQAFLGDLCTPQELEALAGRWAVVNLLKENLPYRQIHERCGVSLATITRVARSLKYGTGGYEAVYQHTQAQRRGPAKKA